MFAETFHHVGLQFFKTAQFQFGKALFAQFAIAPSFLRGFVAAEVNIFRRENVADFVQNVPHDFVHLVVACAQNILADTPLFAHFRHLAAATEFRIGGNQRNAVPRHVKLRHDVYVAFLRVGDKSA